MWKFRIPIFIVSELVSVSGEQDKWVDLFRLDVDELSVQWSANEVGFVYWYFIGQIQFFFCDNSEFVVMILFWSETILYVKIQDSLISELVVGSGEQDKWIDLS